MAWAFVPPMPRELMPAILGRSELRGHGVGSEVTRKGLLSKSISGFGER